MTNESGVAVEQMCFRDSNILKYCEKDGVLDMFRVVVDEINSRPPRDTRAYFERFLREKHYITVSRHAVYFFEQKYGKKISFYRAFGIVMVLSRRRVACFVKVDDKVFRGDLRPNARKAPRPEVRVTAGAFIPCTTSGNIFAAAYRSQLPSRGKEIPEGRFGGRSSNK